MEFYFVSLARFLTKFVKKMLSGIISLSPNADPDLGDRIFVSETDENFIASKCWIRP